MGLMKSTKKAGEYWSYKFFKLINQNSHPGQKPHSEVESWNQREEGAAELWSLKTVVSTFSISGFWENNFWQKLKMEKLESCSHSLKLAWYFKIR